MGFCLSIDDIIIGFAFSVDGRFLARAAGKRIYLWDLHNRALARKLNVAYIN
jgi:hypothetical protein